MLVLMLQRVSSRVSGFLLASPCLWILWGKLQFLYYFTVSKRVVMWFCVAGVALGDILMCLQTCRKSFCVAGAMLLRRFKKMSCISRGRRSTLETSSTQIVWLDEVRKLSSTPHFTLHTLHSTLYTSHPTLCKLHFTLDTLHYTLHSALNTPHFTLHTLHFTLHIPNSTLQTLHSTLYSPHPTLYTPHPTLYTYLLYTLHSTLYTPHFTPHT